MPHKNLWYYYIRMKGKNWRIGIVNKDGESVDVAGLNVEVWHTAIPTEVVSLNDELPIPDEHVAGFIKGIAYELLLMSSNSKVPRDVLNRYKAEYEEMIAEAQTQFYQQRDSPKRARPIDLRNDTNLLSGGNFKRQR
ncbi:MAG: hypothetical protein KAS32_24425 [Candidatus Peribacteraceae bacterium]|nr:hypothetical protein [Candidatus Peribacteraceae bacterium]